MTHKRCAHTPPTEFCTTEGKKQQERTSNKTQSSYYETGSPGAQRWKQKNINSSVCLVNLLCFLIRATEVFSSFNIFPPNVNTVARNWSWRLTLYTQRRGLLLVIHVAPWGNKGQDQKIFPLIPQLISTCADRFGFIYPLLHISIYIGVMEVDLICAAWSTEKKSDLLLKSFAETTEESTVLGTISHLDRITDNQQQLLPNIWQWTSLYFLNTFYLKLKESQTQAKHRWNE